jgi:hypothetical protein
LGRNAYSWVSILMRKSFRRIMVIEPDRIVHAGPEGTAYDKITQLGPERNMDK